MASFLDGTEDFIGPISLLQQIVTDSEFTCPRKHGEEFVSCAGSSDGSVFAWSLGTRLVFVVHTESAEGRRNGPRYDLLKRKRVEGKLEWEKKCLDCTAGVTALAFGCRSSDKTWQSEQVHYNRLHSFAKGKNVLATGLSNGEIKIWELDLGRVMLVLQDHKTFITDLAFSPDGSFILASSAKDSTVKLWDLVDDGNMFLTLNGPSKVVHAISWSPNAEKIASVGTARMAIIWDVRSGNVERKLEGHQNDVTGCCFSPDGALLYTSSADTKVICWDALTGENKVSFSHMYPNPRPIFAGGINGHEVRGVAVSQDGMHIASFCNDGYLRVWNILDAAVPLKKTRIDDSRTVRFSHEGHLLVVGCQSGAVQFFSAPTRICSLQHGCRLAARKYLRGSPCTSLTLPRKTANYLNYSDLTHAS